MNSCLTWPGRCRFLLKLNFMVLKLILNFIPTRMSLYLRQGLDLEKDKMYEYIELPYRLGLITATGPNAISALCKK